MQESLKNKIYTEIMCRNYCPLDIIHILAKREGQKQSTAERRARDLEEEGKVETIYRYRENGTKECVLGYKLIKREPIKFVPVTIIQQQKLI